jgi:hypothetical protein
MRARSRVGQFNVKVAVCVTEISAIPAKALMIGGAASPVHLTARDARLQVLGGENKIAREGAIGPLLVVVQADRRGVRSVGGAQVYASANEGASGIGSSIL